MHWLARIRALVRNLFRRSAVDRDLNEELASYVDLAADEAREQGLAAEAARRQARLQLGGAAAVTESVRANRAGAGLERFWQDVRYAVRGLGRAPGYTIAAILTLGLGIGANTAVFSVVDAALFKPLPYHDPDQLVVVAQVLDRGTPRERRQIGMSWRQVDRWRAEPSVFSSVVTVVRSIPARIEGVSLPETAAVSRVSINLLQTFGIQPKLGRAFLDDDIQGDSSVILAEEFWRRAFKADPRAIGQPININSRTYTIIGVAPASMRWGLGGRRVVAWLPLDESVQRRSDPPFVATIARLRPGLTFDQGQQAIRQALRDRPSGPADSRYDADLIPFDSRERFDDTMTRAHALAALLGAVGFVLLIGCANVANMVLTRVLAREREIAVRSALGATRGRLFRQLLTEGLLLVGAGAACAALAAFGTAAIAPEAVPDALALFEANPAVFDGRTLAMFAISLFVTTVFCCVMPAMRGSRSLGAVGLTVGVRAPGSGGRRWLRLSLQAGQVALTLVLLAGASLLATSFARMVQTSEGYDAALLASASLTLRDGDAQSAFDGLLARVQAIPGVQATFGQPPTSGSYARFVAFGRETADHRPLGVPSLYQVEPDYFSIAGLQLKSGRFFTRAEVDAGAAVAVIDERAAALLWPGERAVGQRLSYSSSTAWLTVVGIAGHVKTRWFKEEGGTLQVYIPFQSQGAASAYRSLLVRSDNTPETLARVRSVVRAFNPAFREVEVTPVRSAYEEGLVEPRFFAAVMVGLAAIALLTAGVGLYGVVNYAVRERTREIGVRIALGADLTRVRRLVLREALRPLSIGMMAGLLGAWWLTRYLASILYNTTPHDPAVFGGVMLVLLAVATIAAYLPARRATRINPVETLRAE